MDNKSLQRIIERIPELKFKYIGSFPADFHIYPNSALQSLTLLRVKKSVNIGYRLLDSTKITIMRILWLDQKHITSFQVKSTKK